MQTRDTQTQQTHSDPGHTQDTGTPRQLLCRLLHTKPRGAVRNRPSPARSRCRSRPHSPRAHGHRHAGSVTRTHGEGQKWQPGDPALLAAEGTRECGQKPGSERRPAGPRQCPEPPGLLWSTSSKQEPHHLNTTAQGPRAAHGDTPGTRSARLWLQWLQIWPGKGLSWHSDGAQEPLRSIVLGVPVTVAECWLQDGAQKSI